MAPLRQQRNPRNRRVPPGVASKEPPQLATRFVDAAVNFVKITVSAQIPDLVVTGVPALTRVSDGAVAFQLFTFDTGDPEFPTRLEFIFPSSHPESDSFTLVNYDAAFRTRWGGFLPPLFLETAPAPLPTWDYTAVADGTSVVQVTCAAPSTSVTLPAGDTMVANTAGAAFTFTRVTEVAFAVTFFGLVNPGDTVVWTAGSDGPRNQQAGTPDTTPHTA